MLPGWSSESIAGKRADIFQPATPPRFGLLYLHPYGLESLADNEAYTRELAARNLACICPHGGRCWWLDRLCREFDAAITPEKHLLDEVVPFFDRRWGLRPRALGVFGIS